MLQQAPSFVNSWVESKVVAAEAADQLIQVLENIRSEEAIQGLQLDSQRQAAAQQFTSRFGSIAPAVREYYNV